MTERTILVVDDSENDVELLRDMFKRSRILNPLQTVQTVQDTIHYLKSEGIYKDREKYPFPLLVLLDLHLSDGTGFDVLHWLREHKSKSPAAVVALTGSNVRAIKDAYKHGAHSFLVKPLKFAEFENMVNNLRGLKLTRTPKGHVLETDKE